MIRFLKSIVKSLRERRRKNPVVNWDAKEIVCHFPDHETKRMAWNDLRAVVIETTDEGPWMEDVYFILFSDDVERGFGIPQCAEGSQGLLERLTQLPGFNDRAVIKAMGSTSNQSFLCWEKKGWAGQDWPGIQAARKF